MISGLWDTTVSSWSARCNCTPYLSWVSNLLNNLMDFLDSQFDNTFVHPLSLFQLLDEHLLDVWDNLITKILCLFRKCLFDEKPAQDPTKPIVNMANASSPSLWRGIRVLYGWAAFQPRKLWDGLLCLEVYSRTLCMAWFRPPQFQMKTLERLSRWNTSEEFRARY